MSPNFIAEHVKRYKVLFVSCGKFIDHHLRKADIKPMVEASHNKAWALSTQGKTKALVVKANANNFGLKAKT